MRGSSMATLSIPIIDDRVGKDDGEITVTITDADTGNLIDTDAGSATVKVIDTEDLRRKDHLRGAGLGGQGGRGHGRNRGRDSHGGRPVAAGAAGGGAVRPNEDYTTLTVEHELAESDFGQENGRWVARTTLDVTILDNHANRWEGPETFRAILERTEDLIGAIQIVHQDGTAVTTGDVEVSITIEDAQPRPSLAVSVSPMYLVNQNDTSAVTVTRTGTAFAEDQTIELTVAVDGAAAEDTHFSMSSKTRTLGKDAATVTATVTALSDPSNAPSLLSITAKHELTSLSATVDLSLGASVPMNLAGVPIR